MLHWLFFVKVRTTAVQHNKNGAERFVIQSKTPRRHYLLTPKPNAVGDAVAKARKRKTRKPETR